MEALKALTANGMGLPRGNEGGQKPIVPLLGSRDAALCHLSQCLPSLFLALLCLYPVLEVSLDQIPPRPAHMWLPLSVPLALLAWPMLDHMVSRCIVFRESSLVIGRPSSAPIREAEKVSGGLGVEQNSIWGEKSWVDGQGRGEGAGL